jgi:hypothetical protein
VETPDSSRKSKKIFAVAKLSIGLNSEHANQDVPAEMAIGTELLKILRKSK